MRSILRYLCFVGALPVTNAFYFVLNSKTMSCDGDPFDQLELHYECIEPAFYGEEQFYGPKCFWGDTVMISGSFTAVSSFPANGQVAVVPEFLNWQRYNDKDMQSVGRACELLVPLQGQTCGDPGAYDFDIEINLPYKPETWYQNIIDSVTSITIHFKNSVQCEKARMSHNIAVPYEVSGVGLGVAAGALFAILNGKRRRRYNEDDDSNDQSHQDDIYVEMGQQPKRNSTRADDPVVQWRRSDSVVDAMEQHRMIYGDEIMDQYR